MYYFPIDPPYFLLLAGLLAGVTSGIAFEATLKQFIKNCSQNRSTLNLAKTQNTQLLIPFLGISAGVCIFLSSGLQIFGFPPFLAYTISLPLTVLIGWLIWYQLGVLFAQLERGGSRALDLDSFS
ncbi:MAG: hypothetical protein N3E45_16040 [Oscillatoriaceae bacterium SKW80]|nr:hypothetical protein [Oscillatoriaceae bacterium SKYG93]MCX8122309.1 hypothetical protein [Oscillatoriaceae bacterium SKW80]MDW8452524.1 hypothetical protein [Oscillatoriaceae cyanobacterium SKYGB_i_bin93]HIK29630.1 hypothetical protein [Oscillatoriaceae cyanobacterium M7585_C2015_266]